MALKRFTHDPVNDFAPLLCDHGAHDPRNRSVLALYLYTEADHGARLALCGECLAHDRGETLVEWRAHESKAGSEGPYDVDNALSDLADDLGVAVEAIPVELADIVRSYERDCSKSVCDDDCRSNGCDR